MNNKHRILIVDDDIHIIEVIKDFLNLEGFEPDVCISGYDTLNYLKKSTPDLILLDVKMSDMTGIEVAKRIKEMKDDTGFIPIIIISAMDSEEDKIAGLRYADDYITKPFSQEELKARINAHLRLGQLQKELISSKRRYLHLYDNIPEMCISLDKNRTISDCNLEFCKIAGEQKSMVIGRKITTFFHADEHEPLLSFFNALHPRVVTGNQHVFELAKNDENKEPLFVSIRAVCVGEHESGLDIIAALKDMTETIRFEKQQKLARQQLYRSARLASIGTLASGTAHEMNNPLTAILGFSDSLLSRCEENEKIERSELLQYLGIIKSETLRCRDVVENLLKFSRDYESQIEKVSMNDCISSVTSLLIARAKKKNIEIVNAVKHDVFVDSDAQKIRQVLVHVISNSIDFCDSGCLVTIDIEESVPEKNTVIIKIKDSGPGIPDKILPKIFDPFFTTKEVGKGMGLGLAISFKLMEECQGTIDVTSAKNEGTTVTLEFPKG